MAISSRHLLSEGDFVVRCRQAWFGCSASNSSRKSTCKIGCNLEVEVAGNECVKLRCFAVFRRCHEPASIGAISPNSIHSQEDSLQDVLAQIDNAIQYGEDADVKIQDFDEMGGDGDM